MNLILSNLARDSMRGAPYPTDLSALVGLSFCLYAEPHRDIVVFILQA